MAYGVKLGLVAPGSDLIRAVLAALGDCQRDGLLADGDIVCVTESVVARAQGNYVDLDYVAAQLTAVLALEADDCLGVVFPITSRNRFSLILKAMARAVSRGTLALQLSFPRDEVGNRLLDQELMDQLELTPDRVVPVESLPRTCPHPITGVDYLSLYLDLIRSEGARPEVILANDPLAITAHAPAAVVAADIHTRQRTAAALAASGLRTATLGDFCNSPQQEGQGWSEWGLLGSNMASATRLKLAPRHAPAFAERLQQAARAQLGLQLGVVIYGDGAYLDPSSGIYELADPSPSFGSTADLSQRMRQGVKYKLLADTLLEQGVPEDEIERLVAAGSSQSSEPGSDATGGTTPRRLEDVVASLADLVSGSADAGTPVVVVRGFLDP